MKRKSILNIMGSQNQVNVTECESGERVFLSYYADIKHCGYDVNMRVQKWRNLVNQ